MPYLLYRAGSILRSKTDGTILLFANAFSSFFSLIINCSILAVGVVQSRK